MNIEQIYKQFGVILEQTGSRWRACCPFHAENTPSFVVYEDGSFYCFGCSKYGTLKSILKRLGESYKPFPSLEKAQDKSVLNVQELKKKLEAELYLKISKRPSKIQRKAFDMFDVLFLNIRQRMEDPSSEILETACLIRKGFDKIINIARHESFP